MCILFESYQLYECRIQFFIRPNCSKRRYKKYEMAFNRNGLKRGVMRRSRVVFRWEVKHVQYPEDIVSKGWEAGL